MPQNLSLEPTSLKVRVEPKVHPTCQKLRAPFRFLLAKQFHDQILLRIHRVLNWLCPLGPLHQAPYLMDSVLLVKLISVVTLLNLNPKVLPGKL
jgi:hypothetical protein